MTDYGLGGFFMSPEAAEADIREMDMQAAIRAAVEAERKRLAEYVTATEQRIKELEKAVRKQRKRGDERVEAERARIVKWLRADSDALWLTRRIGDGEARILGWAAEAIERGEHRGGA